MVVKEELEASGMLLDMGVSIPLRPLMFFNGGGKTRSVTIRRPYLGGLIRMSNQFLELGVTIEEMENYTIDRNIAFIAEHGKAVSRIVAGAIARGYFTYKLFGRAVAWWLRWRVHPVFMSEAVFQLMSNADIRPFKNIIKSAESVNPMKPGLSRKESGS